MTVKHWAAGSHHGVLWFFATHGPGRNGAHEMATAVTTNGCVMKNTVATDELQE